jgi:hypothetical protein
MTAESRISEASARRPLLSNGPEIRSRYNV